MTDAYEREQSLRRDIRIFRELFSDLNCERAALEKDHPPDQFQSERLAALEAKVDRIIDLLESRLQEINGLGYGRLL